LCVTEHAPERAARHPANARVIHADPGRAHLPSHSGPITILESNPTAHRLLYVRRLAQACTAGATLLTTERCVESDEFQAHLADLVAIGTIHMEIIGSCADAPATLLRRAIRRTTADHEPLLVVPDADVLLPALCTRGVLRLRRRLPNLAVLVMRTPPARWPRRRSDLVGVAKALLIRILPVTWPGARMFFLSDAFGVETTRRGYRNLVAVPDPAPLLPVADRDDARVELGVAPGTFLLGMITAGKHPDVVVAAMQGLPQTVWLLVAGPTDAETDRVLAEGRRVLGDDRFIRVEGYLSPTELGRCVSASDALVFAYDHDGPSSMLISAVQAGVPAIAAGSEWVCRLVQELGVGVATELSAERLTTAISEVMRRPDAYGERIALASARVNPHAFSTALLAS
jgi:hypothetical protein